MLLTKEFIEELVERSKGEGYAVELSVSPSGNEFVELCAHGEYYEIREGVVIQNGNYFVYQENPETNIIIPLLDEFYPELKEIKEFPKISGAADEMSD